MKLDPGEVDSSAWLDTKTLKEVLNLQNGNQIINGLDALTMKAKSIKLAEFFPYYPNDFYAGIGKSSVFALQYFIFNIAKL